LAQVGVRIDAAAATYARGFLSWPAIDRYTNRNPGHVSVNSVPERRAGSWHYTGVIRLEAS
jgi:hypothetical protein